MMMHMLMAAILDLTIFGSSSANRQDGPHYTKDRPEPHNDAHVICFLSVSNFGHQGSSSAHRQDRPQVYYTKMTGYLDILETFLKKNFRLLSHQLMAAILDLAIFGSSSAN